MSTCFIFFDAVAYTPDSELPEQLWSVRLDEAGEVDAPLSMRTPEDIQAIQTGARTVVVLPTAVASLHVLSLPKLSARKVREALPFVLEESLAEPVQDVHVAYAQAADNPLQYCAVVLNKLRLATWIAALNALDLHFDEITLDWFALLPNETCLTASDLLVHGKVVYSALSSSLAKHYLDTLEETTEQCTIFRFDDSDANVVLPDTAQAMEGSYRLFIAQRLYAHKPFNLCQGDFQKKKASGGVKTWSVLALGLLIGLYLSMLVTNAWLLHRLHAKEAVVDAEIKRIYHVFFPEATQVISPRFRIEKLLSSASKGADASFWQLLSALSDVFSKHPLDIGRLEFRDDAMWVSLTAENFGLLEAFEQALKKQQISVKQIEASTRDNQVVATLELRI